MATTTQPGTLNATPALDRTRTRNRTRAALVLGFVAVVLALVGAGSGAYLWHQHNLPSQASAADCALAQNIIDQAQTLPRDTAAVEKWQKDMHVLLTTQMKDGYLALQIAAYEDWAAGRVTGAVDRPTPKDLAEVTKSANSHCMAAKRTLVLPPIAS